MVLDVMIRKGSNGKCRSAIAYTGADAPDAECASVVSQGRLVWPTSGLVVNVRPAAALDDVIDLLNSAYAVQIRPGVWITEG